MSNPSRRPNILFIMSDDHASHAISAYGSRINQTPNIDRIAKEGIRFNNCFCTNSICTPSRATILTGTYNHVNNVTTLSSKLDGRLTTFPKLLQAEGYHTAIVGKWIDMGEKKVYPGYVTDIITDLSLDWLKERDPEQPFMLMTHHKAPHRPWDPDEKLMHLYQNTDIPEPETFHDDYSNRASAAREAKMRVDRDMTDRDLKYPVPEGLTSAEEKQWKYQRYIKDYLRCVASIDNNVGRMLDYLDQEGLAENTIVVYTSDQGFFLGDHGWYDKRFMYEESLRMPFVMRYPREIEAGSINDDMILNLDFAQTFLDCTDVDQTDEMQGRSFRPLMNGKTIEDWRTSMYYRYWMHLAHHHVYAHYGLRTHDYKLIYYYADGLGTPGSADDPKPPEWELFDLKKDPHEINSVYDNPDYSEIQAQLTSELYQLQSQFGDQPYQS